MNVSIHIDEIARVCYGALTAIDKVDGLPSVRWVDLPEIEKEVLLEGVEHYLLHPLETSAAFHNAWVAAQAAQGWTYGDNDSYKKTDLRMVPFEMLPEKGQAQAHVFKSIVLSMI